jgi:hypothetical protein
LIAQAGPDQLLVPGQTITLDGSATGFNGRFDCRWSNDRDATTLDACSVMVAPTVDTTYTLTVTDASGQMATDTLVAMLVPLTASAGPDVNILQGETATIDASWAGASCEDASCIACSWTLSDGTPVASTCTATVAPEVTTSYELTVTDTEADETASDSVSVFVTDAVANVCGWNVVVMRTTAWPTNGSPNYICDADGAARRQTVNGAPAIVLSDLVVRDVQIIGYIGVETTGDDDLIGIIWGWDGPQNFYHLKWKQGTQAVGGCGLSLSGMAVTKIDGPPSASRDIDLVPATGFRTTDHSYTCASMWSTDRANANLLDPGARFLYSPADVGASTEGWRDNISYRIELFYTPTRTKVVVYEDEMMNGSVENLVTEFVVEDSSYPEGQFAFFSASQAEVAFGDFTLAALSGFRALAGPDREVTTTSSVATLSGAAELAVPPFACEWSAGAAKISDRCEILVSPSTTTTYELLITDDFGRVATDQAVVTVLP